MYLCGYLLSTFTATVWRKNKCKNFGISIMMSYNLEIRPNNKKRATLSHLKMISLHNIKFR